MIWLDVDAALSEVPVNYIPLLSDSDFKTIQASVAYDAAGMALKWNFVTSAGAYTQTAVTPTTSGNYDWASQGNGLYSIEIPASGGASINNDTEGFGWFTGVATGILPWAGPILGFRAAGLNDKLIESAYDTNRALAGLALPAAAAEASGGLPTLSAAQASNGTINSNVHRWLTGTPNALQSGRVDSYIGAVLNGVIVAASFAANALDAVWSTTSRTLSAFGFSVTVGTNSDKTGYALTAAYDAAKTAAQVSDIPTAAEVADEVWESLLADHTTPDTFGEEIQALALSSEIPSVDDIWAETIEGSVTAKESLRLSNAASGAKLSGAATTNVRIRDLSDTKDRVDATVDADGNRTAVTLDLT